MNFAAIEARTNASIFKLLANAEAFHEATGTRFPIVFDAARGNVDTLGVQTLGPAFSMQPSAFPDLEEGMGLVINSAPLGIVNAAYTVRAVDPLAEGGHQRVTLARA